jgi:hypothetical protein
MNDIDMESQEYKNTLLRRKRGQSVPKSTKQNKTKSQEERWEWLWLLFIFILIYFLLKIILSWLQTTLIYFKDGEYINPRGQKQIKKKKKERWRNHNNWHQMLMGIPTVPEFQDMALFLNSKICIHHHHQLLLLLLLLLYYIQH